MNEEKDEFEENEALKQIIGLKDELIHTPVRLALLIFLIPRDTVAFPEIQQALNLTPGNLSSHLKKLDDTGLVEIEKAFVENKPTTVVRITKLGEDSIKIYRQTLENTLKKLLD